MRGDVTTLGHGQTRKTQKLALDNPLAREYSCGSLMGDRWRVRMKLTAFGEIPNRLGIREGITLPSRLCYFPSEPTSTNP
jgi:hypothetical protein